MRSCTQSPRSCSVFSAKSAVPAAPSSERAAWWKPPSRSGLRLAASSSARARRAAVRPRRASSIFETNFERGDQLLGGVAFVPAVHVGGRDGDEVGELECLVAGSSHAGEGSQGLGDADRSEQVHLDSTVQRSIEGDRGSGVDHDVADPRVVPPVSSRPRPSRATSPAMVRSRRSITASKSSPSSRPEPVEAVVAQDLAPGPLGWALSLARADEHDHLAFGHAAEQALDERCPEEARRPGHGDSPAGELVAYHGSVSSTQVPTAYPLEQHNRHANRTTQDCHVCC